MDNLQKKFQLNGYVVVHSDVLKKKVGEIKSTFESKFQNRFTFDVTTNRNLIKRFSDSVELATLFASSELVNMVQALGVLSPVYCGPIVSHYTHNDLTGNSYGIPWHQDFPSMSSSSSAVVVWVSVNYCSMETHSLEVAPGCHIQGLLPGTQKDNGYILSSQSFPQSIVLNIQPGDILLFSPYLPHRTYVNPASSAYKLSFSRRFDDLQCSEWASQKYSNAYGISVDRTLYTAKSTSK